MIEVATRCNTEHQELPFLIFSMISSVSDVSTLWLPVFLCEEVEKKHEGATVTLVVLYCSEILWKTIRYEILHKHNVHQKVLNIHFVPSYTLLQATMEVTAWCLWDVQIHRTSEKDSTLWLKTETLAAFSENKQTKQVRKPCRTIPLKSSEKLKDQQQLTVLLMDSIINILYP